MKALPMAVALGWGKHYVTIPEFREAFRAMMTAVDALPPKLAERARTLGYPALHQACIRGDVELVEALLSAGLDPDGYPFTEDETDEPPLIWVTTADALDTQSKVAVASVLLRFGANVQEGDVIAFAEQSGDQVFADFLRQSTRGQH